MKNSITFEKEIKSFLMKKNKNHKSIKKITNKTVLIKTDLFDSFLMLELFLFIEEKFKKKINLSKINFSKLNLKELYKHISI